MKIVFKYLKLHSGKNYKQSSLYLHLRNQYFRDIIFKSFTFIATIFTPRPYSF